MRTFPTSGQPVRFASSLAAAIALMLSAVEAPASAETEPAQTVEASIVAPLRFPLDATYASWPGGQRQLWTIAGSNGHVGTTLARAGAEAAASVGGAGLNLKASWGRPASGVLALTSFPSSTPAAWTAPST